uniref:Uncharacterized protein n=1 Tax=Fagus sylvatica TaxID=28930 RepID=A0A2N9H8F7_FAGSY
MEVSVRLVEGLPSSNRGWKDGYFFICEDNWLRLPEESDDYIRIQRTWGTPSSVGVATMKINKSKLKNMVEKGAPVAPVSVKWKRIDESQSSIPIEQSGTSLKRVPAPQPPPSVPQPPPVVHISNEEIAVVQASADGPTICRSHGLAAKRAEAAITELDFEELAESEASQKSLNRAVFELTKEKRNLLAELDAAKADLLAKDKDVKATVDARDEAVKEMKHLMGQVEGARAVAVSDY